VHVSHRVKHASPVFPQRFDSAIELRELHEAEGALYFAHAEVEPQTGLLLRAPIDGLVMFVTVVVVVFHLPIEVLVVGDDEAALTHGEHLVGVEAVGSPRAAAGSAHLPP
jgi:hypothetical protein